MIHSYKMCLYEAETFILKGTLNSFGDMCCHSEGGNNRHYPPKEKLICCYAARMLIILLFTHLHAITNQDELDTTTADTKSRHLHQEQKLLHHQTAEQRLQAVRLLSSSSARHCYCVSSRAALRDSNSNLNLQLWCCKCKMTHK